MKFAECIQGMIEGKQYYRNQLNEKVIIRLGDRYAEYKHEKDKYWYIYNATRFDIESEWFLYE